MWSLMDRSRQRRQKVDRWVGRLDCRVVERRRRKRTTTVKVPRNDDNFGLIERKRVANPNGPSERLALRAETLFRPMIMSSSRGYRRERLSLRWNIQDHIRTWSKLTHLLSVFIFASKSNCSHRDECVWTHPRGWDVINASLRRTLPSPLI